MSWELVVRQKFSAAHFLENYKGKCEKMHGHTFELEVHLRTAELDKSGISIDFGPIKEYLRDLVPDHQVLNEAYDFSPVGREPGPPLLPTDQGKISRRQGDRLGIGGRRGRLC